MLFTVKQIESFNRFLLSKLDFLEEFVVVILFLTSFGMKASNFMFCVVVGATAVVQLVEKINIF